MKLIILESPNKCETVKSFLSDEYVVEASVGHVTDIVKTGKYQMGIDVDSDFKIHYAISDGKTKIVSKLKILSKQADEVIFATDNDREGYAIAAHLKEILKVPDKKAKRVVFNEITKKCVLAALEEPVSFNEPLVEAAETRAAIDRIIGYRVSPILYQYAGGKSAGRVQSATLKILCDREKEIRDFIPETYYEIVLNYSVNDILDTYTAKYIGTESNKIDRISNITKVNKIISNCTQGEYFVKNITSKERKVSTKAPFTTSTFQQECSSKLGYAPKIAMECAQKLFEGIKVNNEHTGLITYIRTDSSRMDNDFKNELYEYVRNTYGKKYVGKIKEVKSKSKEQDAHECLRCVNLAFTPEYVSNYIHDDRVNKVYKLIYDRTIAAAMSDSIMIDTTIQINNGKHLFETVGHFLSFDGFKKVYTYVDNSDDINDFPKVNIGDNIINDELLYVEKQTQPPKRFSEAALIKEMEDSGIGRPSTYASCITVLKDKDRNYTNIINKAIVPTEHGINVSNYLQEHFSDILSVEYTSEMEKILDNIAESKADRLDVLKNFYSELCSSIDILRKNTVPKTVETVGRNCPLCNHQLVYKESKKKVKFIGCSNFPACKYVEWINDDKNNNKTGVMCPQCGKELVKRQSSKTHKTFIGCSGYPSCNFITYENKLNEISHANYLEDYVLDKGSE